MVALIVDTIGGAEGDRTPDLMTASHALSQLSYGPKWVLMQTSLAFWIQSSNGVATHVQLQKPPYQIEDQTESDRDDEH